MTHTFFCTKDRFQLFNLCDKYTLLNLLRVKPLLIYKEYLTTPAKTEMKNIIATLLVVRN
jgi:hypothetical protein